MLHGFSVLESRTTSPVAQKKISKYAFYHLKVRKVGNSNSQKWCMKDGHWTVPFTDASTDYHLNLTHLLSRFYQVIGSGSRFGIQILIWIQEGKNYPRKYKKS
jgi:hypothetical protein